MAWRHENESVQGYVGECASYDWDVQSGDSSAEKGESILGVARKKEEGYWSKCPSKMTEWVGEKNWKCKLDDTIDL